jgi:predicted metalloprotease
MWFMGGDPSALLQSGGGSGGVDTQVAQPAGGQLADEQSQFVAAVLADTEDVWHALFQRMGSEYQEPKLVLFSGRVRSACGLASAAAGPFYCPSDQKLYIDLSFYQELKQRFGAPGDFAQAYVIAHEVGHHV